MPGQGDINQTPLRLHRRLHQHRLLPVHGGRVLRVHDPRLQRRRGEPLAGRSCCRTRSWATSTRSWTWTRSTCRSCRARSSRSASGGTRLFSGVATYADGEPATADADEYIRQFEEARSCASRSPSGTPSTNTAGTRTSDTLVIAFGITRRIAPAARPALRALPPDPHLAHPGQGAARDRADRYKKIIVIEGNDGQYANVIERILLRRVERVPAPRRAHEPRGRPRGPRPDRPAAPSELVAAGRALSGRRIG